MIHKKNYELNRAPSLFVPTNPALNDSLQNTEGPKMEYNGHTIESMRENSVLFDKSVSGFDKVAKVHAAQLANVPEVQKLAKQMTELKDYQTGQGRKR